MTAIDALYVVNSAGKIILQNQWRSPPGGTYRHIVDHYFDYLRKLDTNNDGHPRDIPAVIATPTCSILHLQADAGNPASLTFLSPLSTETDPLAALELIRVIVNNITEYVMSPSILSSTTGVRSRPTLTEDAIKDHFDVVYQVLEEMIDGSSGHPFTTEVNALKEVVIPPSLLSKVMSAAGMAGMSQMPSGSNMGNGIPWRKSGVRYSTNDIYFDIIEEIDALLEKDGTVTRLSVFGRITANCRLSGNPDLLLSFTQPKIVQDVSFHPCVRYSRWIKDSIISFIPPDGNFELLTYRPAMASSALASSSSHLLPLTLRPRVTLEGKNGTFALSLSAKRDVEGVVVILPLPAMTAGCNVSMSNSGGFFYDAKIHSLKWELGNIGPHDKIPVIQGTFTLQDDGALLDHYVCVTFEISSYVLSGLKVDRLKLQNEGYTFYKGVKSTTRSGIFQVRY